MGYEETSMVLKVHDAIEFEGCDKGQVAKKKRLVFTQSSSKDT